MTLRVVVRNARMAFTRKRDALIGLRPDIAVIPECGRVIEATSYSSVWFGSIRNKGLAIFGFDTYQVSLEPGYDDSIKEVAPAWVVAGANRFFLLAVWSQRPYGEAIQRALVTYRAQLTDGPPLWPVTSIQILCSTKVGWSAITVELFTLARSRLVERLPRSGSGSQGSETGTTLYWSGRQVRERFTTSIIASFRRLGSVDYGQSASADGRTGGI